MSDTPSEIIKATLIGNKADKIALRDINETHNYSLVPASKLGLLFQKLKEECEEDKTLQEFINDLQVFTRKVEGEDVEGLETNWMLLVDRMKS
ncbi:MAG: hypothetical protein HQL35_09220 [Alphaproteobacteria bacterium]|nr:hypothetical protein [Alphaproteobacteria bacterium]